MAVLLAGWSLWAQNASIGPAATSSAPAVVTVAADQHDDVRVLRVYNVSDLIDQPVEMPKKSGIPPTRLYEPREQHQRDQEQRDPGIFTPLDISNMIGQLFERGTPLLRAETGGAVLVEATQAQQVKIDEFLKLLRKARAARRNVVLQAWWLMLDNQKADKLFGPTQSPLAEVAPDQLASLDAEIAFSGSVAGLEDRPLYLSGGPCQTVVTDGSPIVSENVSAYDPMIQIVQWGPVLELTPGIAENGATANINVRSVISQPDEKTLRRAKPPSPPASTRPADEMFRELDRLDFNAYALNTSVRIPVGKPVLLGKMQVASAPAKGLFLVVQLKVQP
jgi:hypothetical protein